MSAPTVSANGRRPATRDRRAAARDAYRASLAAGAPLSGAAVGRQFDMSERWGRDRVAEVQRDPNAASSRERLRPAGRDGGPTGQDTRAASLKPTPVSGKPITAASTAATPACVARPDATGAADDGAARGGSWLDSVIILAVAVVAAAASYGDMLEVAVWAGEPLWLARAFPLTVDGLVLAALRRGRQGRWWLALGIAVSVAANMLARYPDLSASLGPVISAWPPLALFGTHRLLHARRSG